MLNMWRPSGASARIDHCRCLHRQIGPARHAALAHVEIGLLDIVDARRDADLHRIGIAETSFAEVWIKGQFLNREMDLEGRRLPLEGANVAQELIGQSILLDEIEEGVARRGIGDDGLGADLIAIGEDDALSAAVLHQNARDLRVDAHLHAETRSRSGDRIADPSHSAAHKAGAAGCRLVVAQMIAQ